MTREDALKVPIPYKYSGLDDIVNALLEYKKNGKSVYMDYLNGISLYSCDVTMDGAYLTVYGMPKAKYDAVHEIVSELHQRGWNTYYYEHKNGLFTDVDILTGKNDTTIGISVDGKLNTPYCFAAKAIDKNIAEMDAVFTPPETHKLGWKMLKDEKYPPSVLCLINDDGHSVAELRNALREYDVNYYLKKIKDIISSEKILEFKNLIYRCEGNSELRRFINDVIYGIEKVNDGKIKETEEKYGRNKYIMAMIKEFTEPNMAAEPKSITFSKFEEEADNILILTKEKTVMENEAYSYKKAREEDRALEEYELAHSPLVYQPEIGYCMNEYDVETEAGFEKRLMMSELYDKKCRQICNDAVLLEAIEKQTALAHSDAFFKLIIKQLAKNMPNEKVQIPDILSIGEITKSCVKEFNDFVINLPVSIKNEFVCYEDTYEYIAKETNFLEMLKNNHNIKNTMKTIYKNHGISIEDNVQDKNRVR